MPLAFGSGRNAAVTAGSSGDQELNYRIERSLRFNSADSAYLSRTLSSTSTRTLFTISAWVKISNPYAGLVRGIYSGGTGNFWDSFYLSNVDDNIRILFDGGNGANLTSSGLFRDLSAWYHFAFSVDTTQATASNRVKMFVNGVQQTLTGTQPVQNYQPTKILHSSYTQYIGATDGGAAGYNGYITEFYLIDGQAMTPSSFGETDAITGRWKAKAFSGTYGTNGFYLPFSNNSSVVRLGWSNAGGTHVDIVEADGSNQTIGAGLGACRKSTISTSDYSLPSAVNEYLSVTLGTSIPITSSLKIYLSDNYAWANGRNLYINGTQVSSGNVTVSTVSGMQEWTINSAGHGITSLSSLTTPQNSGGRSFLYGLSIDGNTVYSTANDWTPNNFSVTAGAGNDSLVDSPTNYGTDTGVGGEVRGNYCTLNPLDKSSNITLANGNLDHSQGATAGICRSTIGMSYGKWYWEQTVTATNPLFGIAKDTASLSANYVGVDANSWGYYGADGAKYNNASSSAYGSTYTTNDVIGTAFDADAGTLVFYKNGVSQGTAFTGLTSGPYFAATSRGNGSPSSSFNFGQRPFAYTAPSGFKALCTTNLSTPSIKKPSNAMDVVTYTGTGSSLTPTSSLGFSPDLVWIKGRSGATDHALYDTIRGAQARLESNNTDTQVTSDSGVTSFDSAGFTLGALAQVNTNAATYVGWAWDAGSSSATNTDGSITSTVRANPTKGFSIVSWTDDTSQNNRVGHGLGVAPAVVLYKRRNIAADWYWTTTKVDGSFDSLLLNTTGAKTDIAAPYTAPTSTTFSNYGTWSGGAMIAYCFSEIDGYSKFGSYTGNGSSDGPFVWCGFKPRFVLVKNASAADTWVIKDTARSAFNGTDYELYPSSSAAEGSFSSPPVMDYLSNGFKLRSTASASNGSTNTIIFAAFAEAPFKYARAR